MKKFLAIGGLTVAAAIALTGCAEQKTFNDYLLEEHSKCAEVGGHVEVFKDKYMVGGKSVICILPGSEVHLEKVD